MDNTMDTKKIYLKPTVKVIKLNAETTLLQGSPTPPNAPGFSGWLG